MVDILFYEKPGCINNTRQKALLEAAGHQLEVHNLLTEPWTIDRLRPFLTSRPIAEWFNRTAPQIKSGEVIPEQLDAETALALMVKHPILIRRPLMQVGDRYEVGFDTESIDRWISLTAIDAAQQDVQKNLMQQDLQTCPQAVQARTCAEVPN